MVSTERFNPDLHKVFLVSGVQWGDEGKGKAVAAFSKAVDIVAKYNGGHNAGHEVILNGKKYKLQLLPVGSLHSHTTNVLGHGMVIHLTSLLREIGVLRENGIDVLDRLLISDRAHLLLDAHIVKDRDMEMQRNASGGEIGTTLSGIGPCHATRSYRTGVLVGDMLHWEVFKKNVMDLYKMHTNGENAEELGKQEIERHEELFKIFANRICDTGYFISQAIKEGKRVLLEGANGSLLDINMGTYPFVTSSITLASGAYAGLAVPLDTPIFRIGIMKCYQTRVGMGPFPTEFFDENYHHIQKDGTELGVTTGRRRRCGWLDLVAARYVQRINSYHVLYLTKLDVLKGLKTIKICVDYRNKNTGEIMERGRFPSTVTMLNELEPVYKDFPGWDEKVAEASSYDQLPETMRNYIKFIEQDLGVFIQWVCFKL